MKEGEEVGHFPLLKTTVLAGGYWSFSWFSTIPDKWLQTFYVRAFLGIFGFSSHHC